MGQTLSAWIAQVQSLISDVDELDVGFSQVMDVGIVPALAQFSIDKPRWAAVDITAAARYLPLPTEANGWVEGFSDVISIDAPARQTPPQRLLDSDWELTRDPTTATTRRILIPADQAGVLCRVVFTTSWPSPTSDPAVDLLGPVPFQAVTSLAAAMVCSSMASLAARARQGALPSDFVDGSDRARQLLDAAQAWRTVYNTFIGLGTIAGQSSTSERAMRSTTLGSSTKRLAGGYEPLVFG